MFRQRTAGSLLFAACVTSLFTPQQHESSSSLFVAVNAFSSSAAATVRSRSRSISSSPPLHMVMAAGDSFFDDFRNGNNGEDSSFFGNNNNYYYNTQQQDENSSSSSSSSKHKFVTGDELHRLRHQVLALRLELQEARRSLQQFDATAGEEQQQSEDDDDEDVEYRHTRHYHQQRVQELELAIMKTQQVDAEFVYTVSLERQELAEQEGDLLEASRLYQEAMEARAALPQFNLEGLWVGKYSEDGYEMINVTYQGDVLMAEKVTGTKNVPRGQATFQVDLSPQGGVVGMIGSASTYHDRQQQQQQHQVLSPIELGDSAAKQWGCRYLPRFAGQGQVAAEGYHDSQWIDGQLIMVNEYFSFAWLPIGHQVFFGRPTPELILKLMKEETKKEAAGEGSARAFLEKCWEETEHIEDDLEITNDASMMDSSVDRSYYYDEGCFQ